MEKCSKEGVLAVDMETSAVFVISKVKGVRVGALMLISDYLSVDSWTPGFYEKNFLSSLKLYPKILLHVIEVL